MSIVWPKAEKRSHPRCHRPIHPLPTSPPRADALPARRAKISIIIAKRTPTAVTAATKCVFPTWRCYLDPPTAARVSWVRLSEKAERILAPREGAHLRSITASDPDDSRAVAGLCNQLYKQKRHSFRKGSQQYK